MIIKKKNINRYEIINFFDKKNLIGIELGVAEGNFSKKMMQSNKFKLFYGIDSYEEFQHNDLEYIKTKKKLSIYKNYKLIRKNFEEALLLFKDDYFDFIYIDGFAHTGNNGGKTFFDWFRKIKVGGIIAGDDFHNDWPLVIESVNEFSSQLNSNINITNIIKDDKYSEYPSWYIVKNKKIKLNFPINIHNKGIKAHKIEKIRRSKYQIKYKYILFNLLNKIFGKKLFNLLNNYRKKII